MMRKRVTNVGSLYNGTLSSAYTFHYIGNDTLPFRSVSITYFSPTGSHSEATYHFYNSQGEKIADSTLSYDYRDTIVKLYTYLPGEIICTAIQTSPAFPGADTFQIDTAKLDTRGNVVNLIRYTHDTFDPTNPKLVLSYETHNTYDANTNPFHRISSIHAFNPATDYYGNDLLYRTSSYNIVSSTETYYTDASANSYRTEYFYAYNQTGQIGQMKGSYENVMYSGRTLFSYIHL